jgi:hypothetical protein
MTGESTRGPRAPTAAWAERIVLLAALATALAGIAAPSLPEPGVAGPGISHLLRGP